MLTLARCSHRMPDPALTLPDAEATAQLGARLARLIQPGDVVLLYGPLGAGKSTLARGLIRGLAEADIDVPSPTFTLVQTYDTDPAIAHFDLYRLESPREVLELGLDEALDNGAVLIEWPERLGADLDHWLGPDRLALHLQIFETGRQAMLEASGQWVERLADAEL